MAGASTLTRTKSDIKSYLDSRARLSQVWINRWTVLVLLVLVRCIFAFASANSNVRTARADALRACTEVEGIGNSMASMPHYMASGINDLTATSIEKAVTGLMTMLELVATAVEEIVLFVIHMMKSTYLCLIKLAVHGSMKAVTTFDSTASSSLQNTIFALRDSLTDTSETLSESIDTIKDKINHVPGMRNLNLPTVDLTNQIEKLKSINIPRNLLDEYNGLNDSIPAFDDVEEFVDDIIRLPFEEVKKQIHGLGIFRFDRALLPVPAKEQLDFCTKSSSISRYFEGLLQELVKMRNIVLIVLAVSAVLFCILAAWIEVHWNTEFDIAKRRLEKSDIDNKYKDLLLQTYPNTSSPWELWLCRCSKTVSGKNSIRWILAYTMSPPMMFILTLGGAGLLSCGLRYLLLKTIHAATPKLTGQVATFAEEVVSSLRQSSISWATGVNEAIQKLDKKLNEDILGFAKITTSAINSTLDAFVEKSSTKLDDAFGGTVLKDPMKEVLNCLIGLKIASFQKGLTWVHDHAHVSFSLVNNETFAQGALRQLNSSHSAAELLANTNGKGTDEVTGALSRVADRMLHSIRIEALISGVVICCWLLTVTGGVMYISTSFASEKPKPKTGFPFESPGTAIHHSTASQKRAS
jgi:hypothetical protein